MPGGIFRLTAHPFQYPNEFHIPLEGIEMHIVHPHRHMQERAHGMEIAGGGDVRLYLIIQDPVMLPGPGQESSLILGQDRHAELCHHAPGHLDIGHAVGTLDMRGEILLAETGGNQQGA